ncbi:MAG: ABC-type multidrug transport system, ATPase component [Chthonomonadales bacterium]|nr:ABC-type multidrug transport system, ATPase component [Chthonomonadales bacterium]
MAMIEIKHLRKEYKDKPEPAVKDLTLELEQGDIFGFIGPNGAGKTTTIKMLATLLIPTAGSAMVNGIDVVKHPEQIRSIVGYMPDFFGVYDDIKVWEYLDFFAAAYRIPKDRRPQIIDDVLALTDLTVKKDAYVEALSRGMKQRLCLAKTLVHDPKVMLLDEPASGLDPRARIEIRELLKELQAMGKTIIVSSHILPEMEEFCNKVGIIERGEMIVAGDVNTIARTVRGHQNISIAVVNEIERAEAILLGMTDLVREVKLTNGLRQLNETSVEDLRQQTLQRENYSSKGSVLQVSYIGEPEEEYHILTALVEAGIKVRAFYTPETDLEDVFLRVTKGQVA